MTYLIKDFTLNTILENYKYIDRMYVESLRIGTNDLSFNTPNKIVRSNVLLIYNICCKDFM